MIADKRIHMADETDFAAFFEDVTQERPTEDKAGVLRYGKDRMRVGPYICFSGKAGSGVKGYTAAWGRPTAKLMALLEEAALVVEDDTLSFEVIPWADGRTLLTAQHGKIIGSYWLTTSLDRSTLPAWAREE